MLGPSACPVPFNSPTRLDQRLHLNHRSHTSGRADMSQTSPDSRQSRAAHTHPVGPAQTWRAATTPTLGIGRMGAAREKALPSNARRFHRSQPDSAKPSRKSYLLIPGTTSTTASAPHY